MAGEIRPLTSLRGIAALMVVAQHFSTTAERHAAHPIPSLVPHGYVAVDLFFVLSGFIMGTTYAADFAARGGRAMPSFLLRRVARIVPLNTAAVLGIVLLGLLAGGDMFFTSAHLARDLVCNLLLLQGFGIGTNLNGPSWSISTEFAAYLCFPVLLALAVTAGRRLAWATGLGASLLLLGLAVGQPRLGLAVEGGAGALVRCFTEFTLGLLTFRVVRGGGFEDVLRRDVTAMLAAIWGAAALLLRVDLLAAASFPLLIAALARNRGRVAAVLSAPVPYLLGEISFSVYLLHNPVRPVWLAAMRAVHPAPFGTAPALAAAALGTLAVLPLAWIGYRAIERPGRRWVRGAALAVRPPVARRG